MSTVEHSFQWIIIILFIGLLIWTANQIRNKPMLNVKEQGGVYINVKGNPLRIGKIDRIVKGDSTITIVLKINDKGTVQE